jgi:hypothetical protein
MFVRRHWSSRGCVDDDASPLQKSKRIFRAWQPLGQWDPTTDLDELIVNSLALRKKLAVAGITTLSSFKSHVPDPHLWKVIDIYRSPEIGVTVTRY